MDWRKTPILVALVLVAAPLGACDLERPEGAALGQQLYQNCAFCHGSEGQGTPAYAAPAIAGLDAWYIEAQLHKFKEGARGDHPDDLTGLRMRPMARTLVDDEEIAAVTAHVAAMPRTAPAPTVEGGDAAHGAQLFAVCVQCHGQNGEGNQALNAPRLTGASDWYLVAQLKKFKAGIRGADPADASGATMRPMSMTLDGEQAMKDVVAHIQTLGR